MSDPDGVSESGDGGGQSEGPGDSGVSEETTSAVEEAIASGGDGEPSGSPRSAPDDGPMTAEDAEAAQERLEAEGAAARESFERREQAVAEMERAANDAALDAAVENHEWTEEELAAIERGTAAGAIDAAEGWVSDVVDGVVETATVIGQGAVVGVNSGAQVLANMGLERAGFIGQAVDMAAEVIDFAIPDEFAQEQAQSLRDKADALVEQIEAIPEIPDALRENFEANLALADAMEAAYVSGRADISVLEESARLRSQTVAEMGILAAEVGSVAVGGAGLAVKAVRGMAHLDLDLPGGAIGALGRATDVARSVAEDLRGFALGEGGALDLPAGQPVDRDWIRDMIAGRQFDRDNWHRYEANEVTVSYDGNPSGYARVDSLTLDGDTITEIVSRKNSQLADVQVGTALAYLRELSTKYPVGAEIPDTPRNRELGLNGDRLNGQQILEVPVQTSPIPQEILDYAQQLRIDIRDIEGRVY